ncbi:MAG: efflux RND transporter periplasmic adaptor subunit [Deltaproteobacteria bacterium]|nr:efflux RND transporter periplasmic adaptor subunit [Deltaproteobacteria bacterium]
MKHRLVIYALLAFTLGISSMLVSTSVSTSVWAAALTSEKEVLYWYDPMKPDVHFDKPGPSPFMDMDLVPRYAGAEAGQGVYIDPAQVQNLAVRTVKVELASLVFSENIPANVEFNDYQLARVQPRAEGFVEKIYTLAVGDIVKAGQALADITVPAWASDQSEYLLLKSQQANSLILRGVRERLRLGGMPEEMLKNVESTGKVQTRLTILAPIGGVITSLDVYPGMNVDKNMTIATIRGTNPVWISADVPERALHLLEDKHKLRITIPAYPGREFQASSYTLLPEASKQTRTVPLRISLDNADGALKPGMTASIRLRNSSGEAMLIPTQSLIDLGEEQHVITRAANGNFVPKLVQVLRSSGDKTAVQALGESELQIGDEVVVSGLFLIDSEANLSGALNRMRATHPADAHSATHPDAHSAAAPSTD